MIRIGVIADDLTGAADSAVPFLALGPVQVGLWPHVPSGSAVCLAVSTESREAPSQVGFERSKTAARNLRLAGCDLLYRKVDSQLRGSVAADLAGVLDGFPGPCVLAPALPEAGRRTVAGRQLFGTERVDIAQLLEKAGRPVVLGGIAEAAPGLIAVCDAETDADLDVIAAAVAGLPEVIPAGSAGLASALARTLAGIRGLGGSGWPSCRRPVAVVGSPESRWQAAVAARLGWTVIRCGHSDPPPRLDAYDGLALTGGQTAAKVLTSLGAQGLDLIGLAAPLMPVGRIVGGSRSGLPVALKSGAFGSAGTISAALQSLRRGRR
ncbi:MAG: hypothetical protein E6I70_06475 [Chloroflexi bacterium]|nr:MAG: hypothetical protein E6I70_06475 [Chloroflexota bacterium]